MQIKYVHLNSAKFYLVERYAFPKRFPKVEGILTNNAVCSLDAI